MIHRLKHATLFALYQFSIALGIVLLPLAVALTRVGVTPPVHRAVDVLGEALENARSIESR